ncbi:MAG: hypothetical protein IKU37_01720 [Candidatus Gastranaerophilales bacterium]|nr:hypothetical protein [Candidatus Gastranaerophilales bacterium]
MNISLKQNIYNISFQKTLKAKASIKKDGRKFPVQIYHLDKNKDMDTFEDALHTRNWDGNFYSENFITFCPEALDDTNYSLYTLENDKEVLGCVEIERKEDNIEVFFT